MKYRSLQFSAALILLSLSLSGCGGTPEEKEARYLKHGEEYFAQKQYDKARVEYQNAERIKPTDANAIYHLGMIDDVQGNFRDAFNAFTRAEQQDKRFHPALLKLAEYYLASGQYDQAVVALKQRIVENLAPGNAIGSLQKIALVTTNRVLWDQSVLLAKAKYQETGKALLLPLVNAPLPDVLKKQSTPPASAPPESAASPASWWRRIIGSTN